MRHIPQHFWQAATSSRRLPGSLEGVTHGGAIPNLAANRAPLPPLKRTRRPRDTQQNINRAHADDNSADAGSSGDGASDGAPAAPAARGGEQTRRRRPRRRVQQEDADWIAEVLLPAQGGGAVGPGEGEDVGLSGAGVAMQGVGERRAARQARQRLGAIVESEGDDMSVDVSGR